MKDHHWGTVSTIIGIVTTLVVCGVAWGTLSSKADTAVENHVKQELRIDKVEDRVRALETDRAIETQLNTLTNRVVELSTKVDALTEQIKGRKR